METVEDTRAAMDIILPFPILYLAKFSCIFHLFSFATNLLLDQRGTRLAVFFWESDAGLAK